MVEASLQRLPTPRGTSIFKRILITGAGGFVGSYLCAALAAEHPAVRVIATSFSGGAHVAALDLTDAAAVDAAIAREQPDAVVHLAAQASVGAAQAAAAQTWAINLGGTLNLALAVARRVPQAVTLFASSAEVYGRAFNAGPVDEKIAPDPVNAYARSKLMAERILNEVLPQGAALIVARPFNHTGPGQREDFVLPSFAGQIARIEAGVQPPLLRVGNLDASRDFLDVRDVVSAYVGLLAASPLLPSRFTCNVATGGAQPVREVLDTLRRLASIPFEVEVDAARLRASDIPFAAGRAERLHAATGWAPVIPIEETLAMLLDDARRRHFS